MQHKLAAIYRKLGHEWLRRIMPESLSMFFFLFFLLASLNFHPLPASQVVFCPGGQHQKSLVVIWSEHDEVLIPMEEFDLKQ